MRTAITLGKKYKDWIILSGPEVSADKQRLAFSNIGLKWPKDISEVRFQMNDGVAKTKSKAKAESAIENMKNAQKHSEDKLALGLKIEADAKAAEEKKSEDAQKQQEASRVAELKAKEQAKLSTYHPAKPAVSK